jgi:hypothetical protein
MLNRKPNRDLEEFFRRVQMSLNNRGGGGGGRFESSQRQVAPAMGTTSVPQQGYTSPGFPSRMSAPTYTSPGFKVGDPRVQDPSRMPRYTSPGFPSPAPKVPNVRYDQIQRGNSGAPGMWNENTGAVNPAQPMPNYGTRQPIVQPVRTISPYDQYRR